MLLYTALLLAILPMRDLWSPDEPDFAQCVREMRERGSWLLPYLNGMPYSEKPILFYWLMKTSAIVGQFVAGGAGFTFGIAAWALRLPSVAAAILFVAAYHRWVRRFLDVETAELGTMILATTPIWFWQAQFIQIDMTFAALLAGSWLSWLGGYLILREHVPSRHEHEARSSFLASYAFLGLAILAKGPLALVLSLVLILAFLAWQHDFQLLRQMRLGMGLLLLLAIVAPWYAAAALKAGPQYAYQMVIHQNLERAMHAWDHVQPWWSYGPYLAGDFFPWSLVLPTLAVLLYRKKDQASPLVRFAILAFSVPFVLLSFSQSKQSKYLLMVYPFLAILMASMFKAWHEDGANLRLQRWAGRLLAVGVWLLAAGALAIACFRMGGHQLQEQIAPYLGPLRLAAAILLLGALLATWHARHGDGRSLVRRTALTLGVLFLAIGTWGFHRLDPAKNYRVWTKVVQPQIAGRNVFFWQTIRSGVMVYTDHHMPELRSIEELGKLGPKDRLVAMRREWEIDARGMNAEKRNEFEVLLSVPIGSDEAMLLKRKP